MPGEVGPGKQMRGEPILDMSIIYMYSSSVNGKVRGEIKQRRPFRSVGQEAVVTLLRTADVVRRYFETVVKPYGLTFQQYNVLRILRGADPEGLPTLEIGERMLERTPGVTRLVDRLTEKGLVERVDDPEDRRRVICRATEPGVRLLEEMDPVVDEADESALGTLSEEEQRALIQLLDRVRAEHAS